MNIQQAIAAVIERVDLSTDEMTDVMRQIMTGGPPSREPFGAES